MENIALLYELCYIYAERNKLQDRRNSTRFKLNRVKNKFNKCKSAANKLAVMKAMQASLEVRIEIAEHVTKTTKRVREISRTIRARQWHSGCNKIKSIRLSNEQWIHYYDFEKFGREYVTQLAVEIMLKG